jgi:hypothetical protein
MFPDTVCRVHQTRSRACLRATSLLGVRWLLTKGFLPVAANGSWHADACYQRGRVVATEGGGGEIRYNVYLTDPTTGRPKRHHRSCVVGYKPKMHRPDAEKILGAELGAINGGPVTRAADGPSPSAIGCGMSTSPCAAPTGGRRRAAPTSTTSIATSIRPSNTSRSTTSPSFRCRYCSTGWLRKNTRTQLFIMCAI